MNSSRQHTQEKNSSPANGNYGILYERMITDLKSEIKFLRVQVGSKDTYFHEQIVFLRQQLENALFKQENSNIGFCNNRHGQHYVAPLLTLITLS